MKRSVFTVLIAISLALVSFALWFGCAENDANSAPGDTFRGQKSGLAVHEMSTSELAFSYSTLAPSIDVVQKQERLFTQIAYPDQALVGETGAPGIPHLGVFFAIPHGATVQVEVIRQNPTAIPDVQLWPVQPPAPDTVGVPTPAFAFNPDLYETDTPANGGYFLEDEKILRGLRVNHLWVSPVRYNAVDRVLEIFEQIEVRIHFIGGTGVFHKSPALRTKTYENLYSRLLINHDAIERIAPSKTKADTTDAGPQFLIITHSKFIEGAEMLRDWKLRMGIHTQVVTVDEIGNTVNSISRYLAGLYANKTRPIEYVMIIGDAEYIPTQYHMFHFSHLSTIGSDHHYACLDGDDLFADIGIGRLPVDTTEQAIDRIAKIIKYEQGVVQNDSYYQTIWHFGYFQDEDNDHTADRRFSLTSEEMYQWFSRINHAGGMTPNRCYTAAENVFPQKWSQLPNYNFFAEWWDLDQSEISYRLLRVNGFDWDCDAEDVTNAINAGAGFVTHRDHGASTGWGDPSFWVDDVNALTNGDLLPVLWSINCQNGWFDSETDSRLARSPSEQISFAEAWLQNFAGGAAGVLSATRISYSGYNDRLIWGWLDAVWPGYIPAYPNRQTTEQQFSPAQSDVVNYGKVYLTTVYTPGTIRRIALEEFLWFGDPTMKMWTGVPKTLGVTHDLAVVAGATSINVRSNEKHALVTVMIDNELAGIAEIVNGQVDVPIETTAPITRDTKIEITVTKDGHRPYLATLALGECGNDTHCLDDLFCNGEEVCDAGTCVLGTAPDCSDDLFCNGLEYCNTASDQCASYHPPCDTYQVCREETDSCENNAEGEACGF
jgi:hypothetical protein